jgi:hypothetical protein
MGLSGITKSCCELDSRWKGSSTGFVVRERADYASLIRPAGPLMIEEASEVCIPAPRGFSLHCTVLT